MSAQSEAAATPTEISLHRESRMLAVTFDNGNRFDLSCEYLRVFSPSAETRAAESAGEPVVGKEHVNITRVEPVGNYAVRIVFDDGHDTGIYSWETLFELGHNQRDNWAAYLQRKRSFEERKAAKLGRAAAPGPTRIKVIYFERLADRFGIEAEEIELAGTVADVRALLNTLIARDSSLDQMLSEDRVKVTVNKHFAQPDTRLHAGDEVAIVPMRPVA